MHAEPNNYDHLVSNLKNDNLEDDDEDKEECDVESHGDNYTPAKVNENENPLEVMASQPSRDRSQSFMVTEPEPPNVGKLNGDEMKYFMDQDAEPLQKPAYRRDFFYDFRNYKVKRKFGLL